MSRVLETKASLKKLIAQGIDQAIRRLDELLNPELPYYNTYIHLKSRYSAYLSAVIMGTASQKELDEQYAKLSHTLILLVDGLQESDLKPESNAASSANAPRQGELLYHIPRQMQEQHEYRCAVRVAYFKKIINIKWQDHPDDVQDSIRVAEVMSVELIGLDDLEDFRIKSLHNTVQFLDENDFTEWIFLVKPKRAGEFNLALRVSVIEVKDNREVKKDIVLEQRVIVVTEKSEPEAAPKLTKSGITIAFIPSMAESTNANNFDNPKGQSQSMKSLMMTIVALVFVLGITFISTPQGSKTKSNVVNGPVLINPPILEESSKVTDNKPVPKRRYPKDTTQPYGPDRYDIVMKDANSPARPTTSSGSIETSDSLMGVLNNENSNKHKIAPKKKRGGQ